MSEKEQLYYVQETRSGCVGNCVLWWGKDRCGYTTEIRDAGLYTEADVRGMRKTDVGWPQELVETNILEHVRLGPLQAAIADPLKGKWS